jgi:hypothetical protein
MTSTAKIPPRYSLATLERAERAVRCTPFQLNLFRTMRRESVDLRAIAGSAGVQNGYIQQPLSEMAVERLLLWLIQVGLLRREVDGQGLTNSFRLTPLGHLLVEQWQHGETLPAATWRDRVHNFLSRWLRLPDWLQPF